VHWLFVTCERRWYQ